ncbi:MAG: HAD family hydrolase [Acidobacteria bacterium]|nr:HAD family hydrolase [Acidobacteriota bacterium]
MHSDAAVILDVDGTLVDSNDAHARAWVNAFAEHGITVAFDHVRRSIGMGGDKLMPEVSGIEESTQLGEKIASRRGEIFASEYLPSIKPFPQVRELLQRFADDGFVLAVASSAKESELGPLLERADVQDLISSKTSSDDADNSKPDPDIVVAAVKQAGCPKDRAIMIGDTPYDVAAARRAGIEIVGFECGGWTREALAGALAVYRDAAHLLAEYERSRFARLKARSAMADGRW